MRQQIQGLILFLVVGTIGLHISLPVNATPLQSMIGFGSGVGFPDTPSIHLQNATIDVTIMDGAITETAVYWIQNPANTSQNVTILFPFSFKFALNNTQSIHITSFTINGEAATLTYAGIFPVEEEEYLFKLPYRYRYTVTLEFLPLSVLEMKLILSRSYNVEQYQLLNYEYSPKTIRYFNQSAIDLLRFSLRYEDPLYRTVSRDILNSTFQEFNRYSFNAFFEIKTQLLHWDGSSVFTVNIHTFPAYMRSGWFLVLNFILGLTIVSIGLISVVKLKRYYTRSRRQRKTTEKYRI